MVDLSLQLRSLWSLTCTFCSAIQQNPESPKPSMHAINSLYENQLSSIQDIIPIQLLVAIKGTHETKNI
jgi:hypothetical protein